MAVETCDALIAERGDTGKIWASMLKDAIKRRQPGFNESYFGFKAFGNLLDEAQARGLLEVGRDEKSGTFVSRVGGPAKAEPASVEAVAALSAEEAAAEAPAETRRPSRRNGRGGRKAQQPEAVVEAPAETPAETPAGTLPEMAVEPPAEPAAELAIETSPGRRPSQPWRISVKRASCHCTPRSSSALAKWVITPTLPTPSLASSIACSAGNSGAVNPRRFIPVLIFR